MRWQLNAKNPMTLKQVFSVNQVVHCHRLPKKIHKIDIHFQYPIKKYIPGIPIFSNCFGFWKNMTFFRINFWHLPVSWLALATGTTVGAGAGRGAGASYTETKRRRPSRNHWHFMSLMWKIKTPYHPCMVYLPTFTIYHTWMAWEWQKRRHPSFLHPIFFRQICRGLFVLNLLMWLGYLCTATRRRSAAIGSQTLHRPVWLLHLTSTVMEIQISGVESNRRLNMIRFKIEKLDPSWRFKDSKI